ncbi:MAG: rhomboid family intramembrane serine protease [Muribaculaceae bacterium]|nr:rhomboid family intramembrane serine protease [Muribaculaceae bacterium]
MIRFIKTVTGALIAANVAMFVVLTAICAAWGTGAARWLVIAPEFWLRPWTLLTYMVTDSGALNTLFNCLWLWLFSRLALEIGSPRQLLLSYLCGGLGGAALFLVGALAGWCPYPLMGASAAVLGVVVFAAARVPYMRINLMFFGPVSFKWVAIIAVGLSLLVFAGGNIGGGLAHIGGALGGLLYALILRKANSRIRPVKRARQKTLDELLDKVRRSGYASLNADERKQLIEYSKKL